MRFSTEVTVEFMVWHKEHGLTYLITEEVNNMQQKKDVVIIEGYETEIETYKRFVAELGSDEGWEFYSEKLEELIDEYEYLQNNDSAYKRYLRSMSS